MREARQLDQYGISVGEPALNYSHLLSRVRDVVEEVRKHSSLRQQINLAGVTIYERTGFARFSGPNALETESGLSLHGRKIILCTGGASRRLPIPGFELTSTHSDAWRLTSVPPSILVIGGGATGVQVASIFNAFGSRVQLYQAGPRILPTEDEEVSKTVAAAFRTSGISVFENFGNIESFEKLPDGGGVRMTYSKDGVRNSAEAALAISAVGWVANTRELNLGITGVELDSRGFVQVNPYYQTTARDIWAAGDITGRFMVVPQPLQAGFVAATHAVRGQTNILESRVNPIGSFTDPEYAHVGLTEAKARESFDVITEVVKFDSVTRSIIDGRIEGFCKLIVDRATKNILGCHVVGDRAVDVVQLVAVAIAGQVKVDELARLPFSFPTYAGILGRGAASIARKLNPEVNWHVSQYECELSLPAFNKDVA
jgi:pyruvate/2-oxoglutarate dehydrogenase complex dihydrolipoamide dehydrogenase (E3) component